MATHEGSENSHTTSVGEEVSPSTTRYRKSKVPYNRDKGKGKHREFVPRLRCFICNGPHLARECPKKETLYGLIKKSKKEEEEPLLGSMQMLGVL